MRELLAVAIGAALDRLGSELARGDALLAAVSGAVVRRLLEHPRATDLDDELLQRWGSLRVRVGVEPLALADLVEHLASVALVDASRAERTRSAA